MTTRPLIYDFCCKAGGASVGYHRAGFRVVGIDRELQPHYPFEFIQADLRDIDPVDLWHSGVAAVVGSPPCWKFTDLAKQNKREYEDFIPELRELFVRSGLPYVIENVEGAPLQGAVTLCGTMFRGLRVTRHRDFEANFPIRPTPPHGRHPLHYTLDKRKAHYGKLDEWKDFVTVTGGGNCSAAAASDAMGIDWMTKGELNQAIPPAYTEWIGRRLMNRVLSGAHAPVA